MTHWSLNYLGIPWQTGGRSRKVGFDCWGLLHYFYAEEYGIEIGCHSPLLGHLATEAKVVSDELASHVWKQVSEPEEGDVVAMGRANGDFIHVGVYINLDGVPSVIHTVRKCNSSITSLDRLRETGMVFMRFYRHVARHSSS